MDFSAAFFKDTYTQADARRRIGVLEQSIEQSVYTQGSGKTVNSLISEYAKQQEDASVLLSFLSSVQLPADPTAIKKMLSDLRDEILTRPVVILAVPFEPSSEQIASYGAWFRENVHKQVLMNINFDASVVGGCSVTWQGKQVTYDLEYLIKQKRNEIVAVVDSFVEKKKKEVVI